jgi:hypothetical protein
MHVEGYIPFVCIDVAVITMMNNGRIETLPCTLNSQDNLLFSYRQGLPCCKLQLVPSVNLGS